MFNFDPSLIQYNSRIFFKSQLPIIISYQLWRENLKPPNDHFPKTWKLQNSYHLIAIF